MTSADGTVIGARRGIGSRNWPEVQVTEGAAHVTQSWSTCSDGDDHASRNGEKQ